METTTALQDGAKAFVRNAQRVIEQKKGDITVLEDLIEKMSLLNTEVPLEVSSVIPESHHTNGIEKTPTSHPGHRHKKEKSPRVDWDKKYMQLSNQFKLDDVAAIVPKPKPYISGYLSRWKREGKIRPHGEKPGVWQKIIQGNN